jgi:hypothetical protein
VGCPARLKAEIGTPLARWAGRRPIDEVAQTHKGDAAVDVILLIVLIVLLLGAVGPRAGWYGAASLLWDVISIIIFLVLLVWILRLLGVLVF